MSTPAAEPYAWQPYVFGAESGDVSVKNTFLDDWANEDRALARLAATRRVAGTWAGPVGRARPSEPESELEGAEAPPPAAPNAAGRPETPSPRDDSEGAGAAAGASAQEEPSGAAARRPRAGRRRRRHDAPTESGHADAGERSGEAPAVRSWAAVAAGARPAPREQPRQDAEQPAGGARAPAQPCRPEQPQQQRQQRLMDPQQHQVQQVQQQPVVTGARPAPREQPRQDAEKPAEETRAPTWPSRQEQLQQQEQQRQMDSQQHQVQQVQQQQKVRRRGSGLDSQGHVASTGGVSGRSKLWCHFFLDESMLVKGFELAKKIIGHGGACTRSIFDATGAKIRFRGKGSCHLEGPYEREAPVHLMLAVTTDLHESDGFREAVRMATRHLRSVEDRFCHFCGKMGHPSPRPGTCVWVGEISAAGATCLGSVLDDLGLVVARQP